MNNFVLSMKITADGAQAIAAVRETERAIGQLHDEVRAKREADIQAYAASMDRLRALSPQARSPVVPSGLFAMRRPVEECSEWRPCCRPQCWPRSKPL